MLLCAFGTLLLSIAGLLYWYQARITSNESTDTELV